MEPENSGMWFQAPIITQYTVSPFRKECLRNCGENKSVEIERQLEGAKLTRMV